MVERDLVREDMFDELSISSTHYINLTHGLIDNMFNPCHLLDYFSRYSGLDCNELEKQTLDLVREDCNYWVHVASIVLPLQ